MPTESDFLTHTDTQDGKAVCIDRGYLVLKKISGNKLYGLTADRVWFCSPGWPGMTVCSPRFVFLYLFCVLLCLWNLSFAHITEREREQYVYCTSHQTFTRRMWVVAKMRFGASYSTHNKFLLVARHTLTTGLLKCLQNWHCKLREAGESQGS